MVACVNWGFGMANTAKKAYPRIKCRGCGIPFYPTRKNQVYHSDKCREDHYKKIYYGQQEYQRTCPACGKEFSTTDSQQIYCEPECRKAAHTGECAICGKGGRMYGHRLNGCDESRINVCVKCLYMCKRIDAGYDRIYMDMKAQ